MRYSHHAIKVGTSSRLLLIYGRDAGTPARGATGVAADRVFLAYAREGEAGTHRVSLSESKPGIYTSGGFIEIDPDLLPGLYQLGLPDEVLAEGATRAFVRVVADGAVFDPVEIALVAYEPQDVERIGVEGLANARRHEFLRRALPRLTEMELALGERVEAELKQRLNADDFPEHLQGAGASKED